MTNAICSLHSPQFQFDCMRLKDAEKTILDLQVSLEEITKAFKSFKPLKAPVPDGFHPTFFQKFWDTIGDSTISFIQDIFRLRKMHADINATLVFLIPKVVKPEIVHQFWPIGVCNTLYKVVTVILFLCLKPLLSNLIHLLQASFILGMKVNDNVIVA